jgi:hypothetical protein
LPALPEYSPNDASIACGLRLFFICQTSEQAKPFEFF